MKGVDATEDILQGMGAHHFTKDAECNCDTFFDLSLALFSFRCDIQNYCIGMISESTLYWRD